jgi:hypothetical protein
MGVLDPAVTVTVVDVVDEANLIVRISWRNEDFGTKYQRVAWVKGLGTGGFQRDSVVELRGVLRVSGTRTPTAGPGNEVDIPVLEPVDVSRLFKLAVHKQKRELYLEEQKKAQLIEQVRERVRQEEADRELETERQARTWLEAAEKDLRGGHDVWARRNFVEIVRHYPKTESGLKAQSYLDRLGVPKPKRVFGPATAPASTQYE